MSEQWKLRYHGLARGIHTIEDSLDSTPIAHVVTDTDARRRARLIAAAPDMLELLAEIRDQHLIPRCGMDDCDSCDDKIFAARIDALVEKIEGGEA